MYFWRFHWFDSINFEWHMSIIDWSTCHDDLDVCGTHLKWEKTKRFAKYPRGRSPGVSTNGGHRPLHFWQGVKTPMVLLEGSINIYISYSPCFGSICFENLREYSLFIPWWFWAGFGGFELHGNHEVGSTKMCTVCTFFFFFFCLGWSLNHLIFILWAWKCLDII